MTKRRQHKAVRWSLADLVDFEALLAQGVASAAGATERRYFAASIRPQLTSMNDESARRRAGLRLWLEHCRDTVALPAGQVFAQALSLLGWGALALFAVSGMMLVAGLLLGAHQAVHVIVFFGLTLVLPWLVYAIGLLLHAAGARRGAGLPLLVRAALKLMRADDERHAQLASLVRALTEARATRRVLAATLAGLLQRGAVGFSLGVVVAFMGCLLLFDISFYWQATPQAGMDGILAAATQVFAAPWAWLWPQAVPDMADISASRVAAGALPGLGDGSWWRFLLLALLFWGLLPRLLLLAWSRWSARRALAALTFQAPRHRALWRQLNTVERGEVAAGPTDGVLVLDVGGHGVSGESLRGFLLRRLRVNPLTTAAIAVLDDEQEARAERALAAGPAGVVLLVEGWTLSPRQVETLHTRLRTALGNSVAMTWLVFALADGQPAPPPAGDLQRWTRQIDALRDPATEVAAYDG